MGFFYLRCRNGSVIADTVVEVPKSGQMTETQENELGILMLKDITQEMGNRGLKFTLEGSDSTGKIYHSYQLPKLCYYCF